MLVKIEARFLIFPGTDFRFPSTSVPPGTFFRLCSPDTLARFNGPLAAGKIGQGGTKGNKRQEQKGTRDRGIRSLPTTNSWTRYCLVDGGLCLSTKFGWIRLCNFEDMRVSAVC